jgi:uncharacterized protein DUF4238
MKHKKQHFIPKSYLKAWCDPNTPPTQEPYVWQFTYDGSKSSKKAPHNIFLENDMYTIKKIDGARDLTLEHGLCGLEDAFVRIREEKIIHGKPLELEEHFVLCAFMAALHSRTKSQREHLKQQWERPLEMMEDLIEWGKTATIEEKKRMASIPPPSSNEEKGLNYEQVKELATQPLQKLMFPMIKALTPLLCKLDIAILETFSEQGFITSDDPCAWFDPEGYKRPSLYQGPGLAYPTIEITLPITPNYMVILNRRGINGYLRLNESLTEEMNRRTRFYSHEFFIVNKNVTKAIWFDPGKEPDDSWGKNIPKSSSD